MSIHLRKDISWVAQLFFARHPLNVEFEHIEVPNQNKFST